MVTTCTGPAYDLVTFLLQSKKMFCLVWRVLPHQTGLSCSEYKASTGVAEGDLLEAVALPGPCLKRFCGTQQHQGYS